VTDGGYGNGTNSYGNVTKSLERLVFQAKLADVFFGEGAFSELLGAEKDALANVDADEGLRGDLGGDEGAVGGGVVDGDGAAADD
jgi:hypothetical protein